MVAKSAKSLQKSFPWRNYTHVGSNCFHDHCCHLAICLLKKSLHTAKIVVSCQHSILCTAFWNTGTVRHTTCHHTGTCAYQHGITVSMIAACKFDDLIFPRITSCHTDCTHNSLCTRIDHSDHIHMRDSVTDKFSHFHFNLCSASKTQAFFTGLQNAFPYCREIVSQNHWPPGIYVINIAVAIYIINIAAFCTFNKSRCFSNSAICTHRTVYTARDSFYRSLKKLLRLCHYPILPSSIIFAISSAK